MIPIDKIVNFFCAHGKSHGHGQNIMGVPVTVAMGNAFHVFFVPMVIAMRMPMPIVMGMPMTMCTGTYTIGKHAPRTPSATTQAKNPGTSKPKTSTSVK